MSRTGPDDREVDFVVGTPELTPDPERDVDPTTDSDDELADGLFRGRARLVLAGAAALVIALIITNKPPSGGSKTSQPSAPPELTDQQRLTEAELVPACPRATDGQSACRTDTAVLQSVLAAVRASFPAVRALTGVTQLLRDTGPGSGHGIWTRRLTSRTGVLIVIRRAEPRDEPVGNNIVQNADVTITYEQQQVGAYFVTVVLRGRAGSEPQTAPVARLVGDQRLLAAS